MIAYRVPQAKALGDVLRMLLGDAAEAAGNEAAAKADGAGHQARYVDPDGKLVATCDCDPAAAAALACALSRIPPGGYEDMVREGALSATASANLHEIMNILTTLMLDDRTPHMKLESLVPGPGEPLAGDVRLVAFDVSVGGPYGGGRLDFAVS